MKFLTSGEQLLPGGFTHSTVSVQAVVALEPLNSGGSPGAELSVRADLLPQRVEFLLDEPENSLSPVKQQELVQFLENAVRFFGCQFVISTHSPFLLSMKGARIYDLDEDPVDVKKWTQLENVRAYYQFFKEHEDEFTAW